MRFTNLPDVSEPLGEHNKRNSKSFGVCVGLLLLQTRKLQHNKRHSQPTTAQLIIFPPYSIQQHKIERIRITMPSAISGHATAGNIPNNEDCGIRDVWKTNIEEEFRAIRKIITKYHYVAMDTEFPGVVAKPIGEFRSSADYQYQMLRCNVDLLRIIQLGLTFMDEDGKTPPGHTTWQFNFKFNLS